jgi:hypothetical protein
MNEPGIGWKELVLGNSFLLSCSYLTAGALSEAAYLVHPTTWLQRTLFVLDQTPGQFLELLGILEPLRRGYVYGTLSGFTLRLAFGVTMVVVIFLTAAGIATLMNGVRHLYLRLFS